MKKIQAETIFEFQYLSSLAVSPSGIHTIYTVSVADKEKNAYKKSIVIDGEEMKQEDLLTEKSIQKHLAVGNHQLVSSEVIF